MLRLRPDHAKPGLELALPVFHPKSHDTLLLRAGVTLNERAVSRLRELRIPEIWVHYPRLEQVAECISPAVESSRAMVTRNIAEAFDMASANMHARLEYNAYEHAVGSLMRSLSDNPKANVFMTDLVDSGQPAVRHATNVCYLSLLMGLKLGAYLELERPKLPPPRARELDALGLAAMLCDVGVTQLPEDVIQRYLETGDDSDEGWQEHVQLGYAMIRGNVDSTAAAAVLHHHQRFDGTGYPSRTTLNGDVITGQGREIHIFARIIAAADVFDRLKHPAHIAGSEHLADRDQPTVRALRQILSPPRCDWIDPFVCAALLEICPPYPPGAIVTLSDGRDAVVVSWDALDPCRPTVVEYPGLDEDPELPLIDLQAHAELDIAWIDGHDVRQDNFTPAMLPVRYRSAGDAAEEQTRAA